MSDLSQLHAAAAHDTPIAYMLRTRQWYLALGYDNPYQWAHYIDVPFQTLTKPLSECTIGLITTAAPFDPVKGQQGPGAPYNARAKFYEVYSGATDEDHDLRVSHVAIDRQHTSMADSNSWFPLPALREMARAGLIGQVSARFHGAPTNRSQRHTLTVDCPTLLARCQDDGVDAVLLVANCPVCHQTLSLVARYLEANGIATVLLGCAKDIVEHCGVPRFLFSDFPLGNAAGKPHDVQSQHDTLSLALAVLAAAPAARTTVQSPQRWAQQPDWKLDYCNADRTPPERLAQLRQEADQAKTEIALKKASMQT